MTGTVVLVHGLWMSGAEMFMLRRRLRHCGFRVVQFRYHTSRRTIANNARALQAFLTSVPGDTVHFVAHSLGGLVIRQLFHDFPEQRLGRIVTLGSPHTGSGTARYLSRHRGWRKALGEALTPLSGLVPEWGGQRELGSIAGTMSIGIAWFIKSLPQPNDGTVAVCETRLTYMNDHVEIHATHAGLLFSKQAAQHVCEFLRAGHFKIDE